jgi:L-aminopeptidase/D-esterase-like protein
MRWLEEQGRGYPTRGGNVPILAGMILYDLAAGDGKVRPDAESGIAACEAAADGPIETGRIGAATGATIDKWRGEEFKRPGGLGTAALRDGDVVIGALVACNAWGSLRSFGPTEGSFHPGDPFEHTTIGVVATTARLDKTGCLLLAQAAHDGYARALDPVHTIADGDAVVAVSLGVHEAELTTVCRLGAHAVEAAIRSALA